MGYVAVKGGQEAIENAFRFFRYNQIRQGSEPIQVEQIRDQLHLLIDRIMSEGSLYAPDLAALAVKQAAGDTLEASFILRAYRTTLPRLGYSLPLDTARMRVIRRISAAFQDIPGGQILGPTPDYTLRLLNFDLINEDSQTYQEHIADLFQDLPEYDELPQTFPKVMEILRRDNLLIGRNAQVVGSTKSFDITRESITFPAPRSAALQAMAMGETGGLLALAYSNMRGYGMVHPTVGELRVGYLEVNVKNPYTQQPEKIGEIEVTEAEIISQAKHKDGNRPQFTLGYGLCFGHNETKAISMAVLDRAMQSEEPQSPSEDQEFVLLHIDGIESMGFCNHYKLPHYVTFQSQLDRLRKAQEKA
ncbi:MAG: carbon-phosphorus lyase complex subunit PhnI [Deltaproteobacteria bacterium]|nr:carbon-phosphorus lyase complex subunit PhnI [Deltaproteobacteria bacterium]